MMHQSELEKAEERLAEREEKAIKIATQLVKAGVIPNGNFDHAVEIIARNLA